MGGNIGHNALRVSSFTPTSNSTTTSSSGSPTSMSSIPATSEEILVDATAGVEADVHHGCWLKCQDDLDYVFTCAPEPFSPDHDPRTLLVSVTYAPKRGPNFTLYIELHVEALAAALATSSSACSSSASHQSGASRPGTPNYVRSSHSPSPSPSVSPSLPPASSSGSQSTSPSVPPSPSQHNPAASPPSSLSSSSPPSLSLSSESQTQEQQHEQEPEQEQHHQNGTAANTSANPPPSSSSSSVNFPDAPTIPPPHPSLLCRACLSFGFPALAFRSRDVVEDSLHPVTVHALDQAERPRSTSSPSQSPSSPSPSPSLSSSSQSPALSSSRGSSPPPSPSASSSSQSAVLFRLSFGLVFPSAQFDRRQDSSTAVGVQGDAYLKWRMRPNGTRDSSREPQSREKNL